MKQKHDWVIAVLAADGDPLIDSPDLNKHGRIDSVRGLNPPVELVEPVSTISKARAGEQEEEPAHSQDYAFRVLPDLLHHPQAPDLLTNAY
jgi:hypothetical protein